MKNIARVALAATLILSASHAFAEELWNPHLRGTDEGLAAGALPPQGVYFINDLYFVTWKTLNGNGDATGNKLNAFIDIPIALWNPGIKVLGADYAVAIAQPFDYTSVSGPAFNSTEPGNGHTGTFNTVVMPGLLSWALPYDFHVKTGLAVYVDDASSSAAYPAPAKGVGAGNSFWTLEPKLGISWLHDGWNLSADMMYDYNFDDTTTHYNSGNMFDVDYTATKTFGKWTAGVGAYQQNQLERDQINGVSTAGTTREAYGIGPIAGYNFGPVDLQATYNYGVITHHDFGGDFFNIRLVAPLY
jgi:hypothetical protein